MKKSIFVVSDLHLGGAPAQDGKPSFQMCSGNGRTRLAEFIDYVVQESGKGEVHLVINGDIVDFLAEKEFAAFTAEDNIAGDKLRNILKHTDEVWQSLRTFVKTGSKLTLLIGNHDIELSLPTPRRLLLDHLGAGQVEFVYDNQAYVDGPVLIEHGNRYDSWNVISHDKLREVRSAISRGENPPLFESPAGSRLVVTIMNRIKAKFPFVDLLKPEDAGLLPLLAVLDPPSFEEAKRAIALWRQQSHVEFDERGIPSDVENIASGTSDQEEALIALADELYSDQMGNMSFVADLKNLVELWQLARESKDKDVQLDRLYRALRARAESTWQTLDVNRETEQFIKPAQAAARRGFKTVVFGHTHLVKRVSLDNPGAQYLNSGTWADLIQVPQAVLEAKKDEGKQALVQFIEDLRANQLEKWRRVVPTYVRIELEDTGVHSADVYLFTGTGEDEPVPNGRLARLAREAHG
jgi:UDP-2,3-diacylglucosamine pyrophosphatase LpxH